MQFFDCNVGYGINVREKVLLPVESVESLLSEMENAGVQKVLVYRTEQYIAGAAMGNALLSEDIKHHTNLFGVWALLPTCTKEIPDPENFVKKMKENRIFAWRIFPKEMRFDPSPFMLRDWLEVASIHNIPIIYSTPDAADIRQIIEIARNFPNLRIIFTFANCHPGDRLLRPLLEKFPFMYIDLSYYFTEGGIEEMVGLYGSSRMLFGSGFPKQYFGHNMLLLRHSNISKKDKNNIAGGNLGRLIGEVKI